MRRLLESLQQTKESLHSELTILGIMHDQDERQARKQGLREKPHSENKTSPPATFPVLLLGDQTPENE